jgi:hypothetical protein
VNRSRGPDGSSRGAGVLRHRVGLANTATRPTPAPVCLVDGGSNRAQPAFCSRAGDAIGPDAATRWPVSTPWRTRSPASAAVPAIGNGGEEVCAEEPPLNLDVRTGRTGPRRHAAPSGSSVQWRSQIHDILRDAAKRVGMTRSCARHRRLGSASRPRRAGSGTRAAEVSRAGGRVHEAQRGPSRCTNSIRLPPRVPRRGGAQPEGDHVAGLRSTSPCSARAIRKSTSPRSLPGEIDSWVTCPTVPSTLMEHRRRRRRPTHGG